MAVLGHGSNVSQICCLFERSFVLSWPLPTPIWPPDDLAIRDPPPAKYKRILYTSDDFYKIVTLRFFNLNVQKLQITNRKIKAIATRCFRAQFFFGATVAKIPRKYHFWICVYLQNPQLFGMKFLLSLLLFSLSFWAFYFFRRYTRPQSTEASGWTVSLRPVAVLLVPFGASYADSSEVRSHFARW